MIPLRIISYRKRCNGIIKTLSSLIPNNEINASIQLTRLAFDDVQLFLSLLYQHDYPSTVIPALWVVKSLISGETNALSFLNDWNKVTPLNLVSSEFSATHSWASKMSFKTLTLVLRTVVQAAGAILFPMIFNNGESTIPPNNLGWAKDFMYAYVGQRLIKAFLFGFKAWGFSSPWADRLVYIASIGLNLAQIYVNIVLS